MSEMSVTQNIARAKSLVKRGEAVRAIEALLSALGEFEPRRMMGKSRSVIEINLHEAVTELNSQAKIKSLLQELTKSPKAAIAYAPGSEDKLATVLQILHKALNEADAAKEREAEESLQNRKQALIDKAKEHMADGEFPRGKAVFRKLAEEFGKEPGVYQLIGSELAKAELPEDAIEFLEMAVEAFPRGAAAYGELVNCYLAIREYQKAEKLYMAVISQFGQHPKTLVNLGKMYIAWNKRDKAFDVLNKAVRMDPSNTEAAELFAKVDR